jgi:DNA polymerase-4
MWKKEKIRHLGVRVSELCSDEFIQTTLFDDKDIDKKQALDRAVDSIRNRFGNFSVFRAVFVDREVPAMEGGSGAEDYPVMSSIL